MSRILTITLLLLGTSFATLGDCEAAPSGRWRLFARSYMSRTPVAFGAPTYPNDYGTRYRSPSVEELYPKYYGNFHYRHLDNIGIPSGDIGLRGNGLYMSPW